MPVFNNAANLKLGSGQVIKTYRGSSQRWAAYNAATGGTVTDVADYNGSGETWRVHTFTSNGTLTVTSAVGVFPFRVLVVAGGGVGGTGVPNGWGGAGGGGGVYYNASHSLAIQPYSVVVGAGGAADNGDYWPCGRNPGGNSSFDNVVCGGGGTGGTGKWNGKKPLGSGCGGGTGSNGGGSGGVGGAGSNDNAQPGCGNAGGNSGAYDITGTSIIYGPNGCGAAAPGRGGGKAAPQGSPGSNAGTAGIVVVAYRIG